MLPSNNIVLDDNVAIDYNNMHGSEPFVRNKRIGGYFEGAVSGLGDDAVTEGKYAAKGDIQLDDNGAPYQFAMSSFLINNVLEAVLGHNQLSKEASYQTIVDSGFPIDWTSTELEGALPSLCDNIGYDVPLSAKFMNRGAPRFIFNKDEMSI